MSRSYKKSPRVKDNSNGRKDAKRKANKKVRRYTGTIANGKSYRKIYDTYDIYDYNFYCPYSEYRESYFNDTRLRRLYNWKAEEDCYNHWCKVYLRK